MKYWYQPVSQSRADEWPGCSVIRPAAPLPAAPVSGGGLEAHPNLLDHVTINPDGTVTVEFQTQRQSCP
jgi:hypothetical protein